MPRAAISQAASWVRMSPNTRPGRRTLRSIMRNSVAFGLPALVQLQRRNAQALGVDLGAVGGVRAGHASADIGVMADRRGIGDRPPPSANSGLKMKMSGRCMPPSYGSLLMKMSPSAMSSPKCRSTACSATGIEHRWPGSDSPCATSRPSRVADRGAVVHDVLQHAGIGGAIDRQHHLVAECARSRCGTVLR